MESRVLTETEIRLSPAMKVGALVAGALLVLMAGGIFAQLLVLQDSNDRIHAQDDKIGDLRSEVDPILDTLQPLLGDTRPLVREARALTEPFNRTAGDLSAAAETAPQVAAAVRTLVGESLPVVETLRLAVPEIRGVLPELEALLPELRAVLPQLRTLLPQASQFLDEAERRAFLRRADAAVSAALELESLQSRSLKLQTQQIGILRETLGIQREALEHIESIDRKTGGQFPPEGAD